MAVIMTKKVMFGILASGLSMDIMHTNQVTWT